MSTGLSPILLAICAAACALAAYGFGRRFTTDTVPEAEDTPSIHQTFPRGLPAFLAGLAAWAFTVAALYQLRDALGPAGQIAVSVALGATVFTLIWRARREDRSLGAVMLMLAWSAYVSNGVYQLLHNGWDAPNTNDKITWGLFLLALIVFTISGLRSLIVNWRDDDALDEEFGSAAQGYVQRRPVISIRARAIMMLAITIASLALVSFLYIPSLFASE